MNPNNLSVPIHVDPTSDPRVAMAQQLMQQRGLAPGQNNTQQTILPIQTQITQRAGNYNPGLEVFSGGRALDTNFATPEGVPVSAPPGKWQVVNQWTGGDEKGGIGQSGGNSGYGRAILLQNIDSGERIHYIHLSKVNTQLGDMVNPGDKIGETGSSGNASGPNLGLEYYDQNGKLGDIMNSPYAQYIAPQ